MKNIQKILIILLITLVGLTLFSSGAKAQANTCQSDMVSTSCTIEAGEIFNGDITIVNGELTIEDGGRLNGNLEGARSDIQIDGWVTGNVTLALGSLNVDDTARINGNVETIGANVDISNDAVINGEQSILSFRGLADPNNWGSNTTPSRQSGSFLGRSIWLIFVSLALAALGLVAVLIFQKPAERMVKTIQTRPLVAFALGLLFVISLPFALVLMAVTIILIPVIIAVALVLPIVLVFAWVTVGMLLCQLLTAQLKWDWAPAVQAAVGTLAITFIAGLLLFIPCLGWTFVTILTLTGLGAFVLLFFKSSLPPARVKAAIAPAAPVSPAAVAVAPEIQTEPLQPQGSPLGSTTGNEDNALDELFPEPPEQEEPPQPPAS